MLSYVITYVQEEIGLPYFTCVYIVTRPFTTYHKFSPSDFDVKVWPSFQNLGHHNLWTRRDRTFTCVLLVKRPFSSYHNFLPIDLDLWITYTENLNLVASRWTSSSSDNSYFGNMPIPSNYILTLLISLDHPNGNIFKLVYSYATF